MALNCGPEYWVNLMNGETTLILGQGKSIAPVSHSQLKPASTVSEGKLTASLRLSHEDTLPPNSVRHVDVLNYSTKMGWCTRSSVLLVSKGCMLPWLRWTVTPAFRNRARKKARKSPSVIRSHAPSVATEK